MGDADSETPEEKLAFLKKHGVVVETPEDRMRAAAGGGGSGAADRGPPKGAKTTFKYICIPADESLKPEELVGHGFEAEDTMLFMLKSLFSGGSIDEQAAKRAAVQHLGEAGTLGNSGFNSLSTAAEDGAVEVFALVRPAKSNNSCGVYIYLDEVGLLKNLPRNSRATGIASQCGFDNTQFYGDIFIGRTQINPSPMRNVDFPLKDLDSSAQWLSRAAAENYEYGMDMRQLKDAMEATQGGAVSADSSGEKQGDGYTWSQSEADVDITVKVDETARAKDASVTFSTSGVKAKIKGEEVLNISLFDKVRPDECAWTLSKGALSLTLEKVEEGNWFKLTAIE
ncbi:hypothetical protein T484DRAFT_1938693 [Baffinella frigidus]|nr:hypothetical protein T484DRAFT_1938693 [Cryptophyta sp. CCMP2293]